MEPLAACHIVILRQGASMPAARCAQLASVARRLGAASVVVTRRIDDDKELSHATHIVAASGTSNCGGFAAAPEGTLPYLVLPSWISTCATLSCRADEMEHKFVCSAPLACSALEAERTRKRLRHDGATAAARSGDTFERQTAFLGNTGASNSSCSNASHARDDKISYQCLSAQRESTLECAGENTAQASKGEKEDFANGTAAAAEPAEARMLSENATLAAAFHDMARAYSLRGDVARARSFGLARDAIQGASFRVLNGAEARARLPGIGERHASLIDEYAQTGQIARHKILTSETDTLFSRIWGIGGDLAANLSRAGVASVEELVQRAEEFPSIRSGSLAFAKRYDELSQPVPREHAVALLRRVREQMLRAAGVLGVSRDGLEVHAGGSLVRGAAQCKDLDVVVTHSSGESYWRVVDTAIEFMVQDGDIDTILRGGSGKPRGEMGTLELIVHGIAPHRPSFVRVDIKYCAFHARACALLYFQSGASFNRTLRLLALRRGFHLTNTRLERVGSGTAVSVATDRDVFAILGVPYLAPHERIWTRLPAAERAAQTSS